MVRNEQLLKQLHHIMHPDVENELKQVFEDLLAQKRDTLDNVEMSDALLRATLGEVKILKRLVNLVEDIRTKKDRVKNGR